MVAELWQCHWSANNSACSNFCTRFDSYHCCWEMHHSSLHRFMSKSMGYSAYSKSMLRTHLPSQEYTMPKAPFPCGLCRETMQSSYGFAGIMTSTILYYSAKWQIWKDLKPVAHRHIAVTSQDPCMGTARWLWGQCTILDCHFWSQNDHGLLR